MIWTAFRVICEVMAAGTPRAETATSYSTNRGGTGVGIALNARPRNVEVFHT